MGTVRVKNSAGHSKGIDLSSGMIECALERILASRVFRRASGARRFLEYVVRETLAGRGDSLKEYVIGSVVCERGQDFDPRIDTIVRVAAIKLRGRLLTYYRTEGATDPVTISIPKGSYRAVFRMHDDAPLPILDDPEALYWQCKALKFDPASLARARRLLMLGVARWPNHGGLHAQLARVIAAATCSYMECIDPEEGVPLMQWAARRAMNLAPSEADVGLYFGIAAVRHADKTELLVAARRAIAAKSDDAGLHNWAASILLSTGNAQQALLHIRRAVALQPAVLQFRTFTACVLMYSGKIDQATRCLRDVLEFEPDDYAANYWLSRAYSAQRRYDDAKVAASKMYAKSATAKALSNLGHVEAYLGNTDAVNDIIGQLEQKRNANEYVPRSSLATIYIASGRLEDAAVHAEAAVREGDFRLAWIKGDPFWEPLRGKLSGY